MPDIVKEWRFSLVQRIFGSAEAKKLFSATAFESIERAVKRGPFGKDYAPVVAVQSS